MEKSWLLLSFLLFQTFQNGTTLRFGAAFDVEIGNAGGAFWMGRVVDDPSQAPNPTPTRTPNPVPAASTSPPTPNSPPTRRPDSNHHQHAHIALQSWKSTITEDPFKILDTWVGPDVCSYKGIFCDEIDESGPVVIGVDLNSANLKGSLVKELSLLKNISLLHINSNRFSGEIPETFKDLASIQELDLSNNNLSGCFPKIVLQMPNLAYLDLRFNSFYGPIPDELFDKKLDAIFLNNNQFDGSIPQSLGNSAASVINFANNKFSGSLPTSYGQLGCKLKEALFLNNQLTGCIPSELGLFKGMEVLDLSNNSFMGQLPDALSSLGSLQVLNLANNKLSGVVSDQICDLKSLVNLTVSNNFFSGFNSDCNKLGSRNVGFEFALNCIPGSLLQRPKLECAVIPGVDLKCLRLPVVNPLVCEPDDLPAPFPSTIGAHGLL